MLKVEKVQSGLEVTWYAPTRNAWLEFVSEAHARQACRSLNGVMLRGVKLSAKMKSSRTGKVWTVQISHVIDGVEVEDLLQRLPARVPTPEKVNFADLLYDPFVSGLDVIKEKIRDLVDRRIIGDRPLPSANQLKRKALVSFRGSPNLGGLAKALDGTRIEKLGNSKVWAAERLEVVIKLRRSLYARHAPKLKETAGRIWQECHVQVSFKDTTRPERGEDFDKVPVHVKLVSSNRDSVKRAKAMIEEPVTEHRQETIARQLRPVKQDHRIRLTMTKDYLSAVNGRFADVETVFGKDIVTLDSASDPPAVVVRGNGDAVRQAKQILRESSSEKAADCSTCPICFDDDIIDTIRVAICGHEACKICFVRHCIMPREAKFPLQCFVCNRLLPINQLRITLAKTEFIGLLHQSLNNYFEGLYARCPGPNCDLYYSVTEAGDLHICPGCLTSVCTKCNIEYHFGETCAEYKDRTSGHMQAMEQALVNMGAKRCTKCNTPIQKSLGCDHMQCPGCHVHFCWVCMETFKTEDRTYAHMTENHRTWFAGEEERLREMQNEAAIAGAGAMPNFREFEMRLLAEDFWEMQVEEIHLANRNPVPPPALAQRFPELMAFFEDRG